MRKKNLIFDGIRESSNETQIDLRSRLAEVQNHIGGFQKSAHLCQIDTVRRLGKKGGLKKRGLLVSFKWQRDIDIILGGRVELPPGVYVHEDMPTELENWRKHLYPIFRKVKKMDKYRSSTKLD